jgi:hypothetical protein
MVLGILKWRWKLPTLPDISAPGPSKMVKPKQKRFPDEMREVKGLLKDLRIQNFDSSSIYI